MLNDCQAEYNTLSVVLLLLLLLLEQPTDIKRIPPIRVSDEKICNFLTTIILKVKDYRRRYAIIGERV
jgi:hypothetical protein